MYLADHSDLLGMAQEHRIDSVEVVCHIDLDCMGIALLAVAAAHHRMGPRSPLIVEDHTGTLPLWDHSAVHPVQGPHPAEGADNNHYQVGYTAVNSRHQAHCTASAYRTRDTPLPLEEDLYRTNYNSFYILLSRD